MSCKIDLITGFLGSGKTTFIKKYARYLLNSGERIGILLNDYGAINVDMMLLSEVRELGCELEMISGGCDYECHKRRFKTKLIQMAMSKYTRVLVEPSGLFDCDEFFDLLYDEPLASFYEMGSVICMVDSTIELTDSLSKYCFGAQLAYAGIILASNSKNTNKKEIIEKLMDASLSIGLKRKYDEDVLLGDYGEFSLEEMKKIASSGYHSYSYIKQPMSFEDEFDSVYVMASGLDVKKARDVIRQLFSTTEYGTIYRIKGFVQDQGSWYEMNINRETEKIDKISLGQDVIIIIGKNLMEEKIQALMK